MITAAGSEVAHLAYVCAALPEKGQSVMEALAADPEPGVLSAALQPAEDGTASPCPRTAPTPPC